MVLEITGNCLLASEYRTSNADGEKGRRAPEIQYEHLCVTSQTLGEVSVASESTGEQEILRLDQARQRAYEVDFPPLGASHTVRERKNLKSQSAKQEHSAQQQPTRTQTNGAAAAATVVRTTSTRHRKKHRRLVGQDIFKVLGLAVELLEDEDDYAQWPESQGRSADHVEDTMCGDVVHTDHAYAISEALGFEECVMECSRHRKLPTSSTMDGARHGATRHLRRIRWSFISRLKLPSRHLAQSSFKICVESSAILNSLEAPVCNRGRWLPTTRHSLKKFLAKHECESMDFALGSQLHRCETRQSPSPFTSAKSRYVAARCTRKCRTECDCLQRKARKAAALPRPTVVATTPGYTTDGAGHHGHRYSYTPRQRAPPRNRGNPVPAKFELRAAAARTAELDLETRLIRALEVLQHRDISPEDYELLLQLDASVARKTASSDVVQQLPTFQYSGDGGMTVTAAAAAQCSVCMDSYTPDSVLARLPCGHEFHKECIERWLLNSSPNCPLDGLPLS
ncbi:uncharacterized protein LOC135822392 [Sycon ciliatum]|uniref:uncharacterized protein LOC135822392 n=1 Tax=Sycon ciliatum TaxID=27933 RepID=UPI0031F5F6A9